MTPLADAAAADLDSSFTDVLGTRRGGGPESTAAKSEYVEHTPQLCAQQGRNHLAAYAPQAVGTELEHAGDEDFLCVVSDMVSNMAHAMVERFGADAPDVIAQTLGRSVGQCFAELAEHREVDPSELVDVPANVEAFNDRYLQSLGF